MRLINHQQRDAARILEFLEKPGVLETLRRDVDQLGHALLDLPIRLLRLTFRQRRIDLFDGDCRLRRLLFLVLHQGNQRAHDHDRPGEKQRRQLVGQALPRPCRHKAQHTAPAEHFGQNIFLPGPESLDAEPLLRCTQDLRPGYLLFRSLALAYSPTYPPTRLFSTPGCVLFPDLEVPLQATVWHCCYARQSYRHMLIHFRLRRPMSSWFGWCEGSSRLPPHGKCLEAEVP